jgi:hypothetical protein
LPRILKLTLISATIDLSINVLTLSGIFFDYIEEDSEFIHEAMDQGKFLPLLDIASRLDTESLTGFDRLEVFMRTLVADKIDEGEFDVNKDHFPFEKVSKSFIAFLMNQMARSIIVGQQVPGDWIQDPKFMKFRQTSLLQSDDQSSFDEYLAAYISQFDPNQQDQSGAFTDQFIKPTLLFESMYGKSIYIRRVARSRTRNLLCLIAPSAQPGDQIWFLRGARVPFVLRKLPNGSFLLRGEAYVHGCMDGEIFSHYALSSNDSTRLHIE